MNSDCHWDREQNERKDEFPVGFFPVIELDEEVNWNEDIQKQISIEGEDIPGQKRRREVHGSDKRKHVPEPVESSKVNHYKKNGHHNGGCCKEFTKDDNFFDRFEMVNISWNDQQNRSRSRPDQICEIGNVEAPGNLLVQSRG